MWQSTKEELDKKWISGPFNTIDEVTANLGTDSWIPSPRFGLQQGSKVRSIDNYTAGGINGAFSANEKVVLQGVDQICALAKAMLTAVDSVGKIRLVSTSGKVYEGRLRSSWTLAKVRSVVGRTLDLEAAYRQIALKQEEQWASVLIIWNPEQRRAQFFKQHALPFGAAASVLLFNRCSAALRVVGLSLFSLSWCSYFDDFPHLEYAELQHLAKSSSQALLKLVGWRFSQEAKKDRPFEKQFDCVGVSFDLRSTEEALITIRNKEGRIESICEMLSGCMDRNSITASEADCLRGRVQYASGQMYDRAGRVLTAMFLDSAESQDRKLTRESLGFAVELMRCLQEAAPRTVARESPRPNVLVFSDGAFEEGLCTCGAILFDCDSGLVDHFGFELESEVVDLWRAEGSKQPIAMAELLPIVLAKIVWAEVISRRFTLYFVDNNSALFQSVSGSAKNKHSRVILLNSAKADLKNAGFSWYARVPSASNPADGPSRLDFEEALSVFKSRAVDVDLHRLTRSICFRS